MHPFRRLLFNPRRTGLAGVLAAFVAFLTTGAAQAEDSFTFAPIPNQIIYVGGPSVVVPLRFTAPAGGPPFTVQTSNSRGAGAPSIRASDSGTNWLLSIDAPLAWAANTPLGNGTVQVSVSRAGVTNRTRFNLTVLPGEFTLKPASVGFAPEISPVWADLDGNGFLDLAGPVFAGATLRLELNTGRFFTPHTQSLAGRATGLVPADFNGDGRIDLLVLGDVPKPLLGNTTLKPGSGQATFATLSLALSVTNTASAAWADLDGDGNLDLLLVAVAGAATPPSPRAVQQFRNDAGTLTPVATTLPQARGPIVAADFDGDGTTDVLLFHTSIDYFSARLFHNDGAGKFTDAGAVFPKGEAVAAGWADFNGDGQSDVWVQFRAAGSTGAGRPATELVLLRQDRGRFTETLRLPAGVMRQAAAPAWGDFDHDGFADFIAPADFPALRQQGAIAVPATNSLLTIWRNDGEGRFSPRGFVATNSSTLSVFAGDADGDGALDVALPGYYFGFGGLGTYAVNPLRTVNFPPTAPEGLRSFVVGTNVLLLWRAASDPNQTAPLTYNLRVGTRSGTNDLVASGSLGDGTRQLVAPGNSGFGTYRLLRLPLLDAEELHWSVQAVDASFTGGPFAPEQILLLNLPGNRPPVISGLTNVTLAEDTVRVIAFRLDDDRTRLGDIKLRAVSANPVLVPDSRLMVQLAPQTEGPLNVHLRIIPSGDAHGTAEISVIATDRSGLATTNTLTLTVTPVNDLPRIVAPARILGVVGSVAGPAKVRLSDEDSPASALTLTARLLVQDLIADTDIAVRGTGALWSMTVKSTSLKPASAVIELIAADDVGGRTTRVITVVFQTYTPVPYAVLPRNGQSWQVTALWGDLDSDGSLELLAGQDESGGIGVYRATPQGLARQATLAADDPTAYPSQLADVDNDGDLDLLATTFIGNDGVATVYPRPMVYLNEGGFSFRRLSGLSDAGLVLPISAWLSDWNGDGRVELAVSDGQGRFSFYRAASSGLKLIELPGINPSDLAELITVSGVNSPQLGPEGTSDLSVNYFIGDGKWRVAYYRFTGGKFVKIPLMLSNRGYFSGSSDFNLDGLPDLSGLGQVFLNKGASTFDPIAFPSGKAGWAGLLVGDLDGEGRPDLVSSDSQSAELMLNLEGGTFAYGEVPQRNLTVGGVASGDFDGDGVLDLAIETIIDRQLVVWRGIASRTNQPPGVPTALRSFAAGTNTARFEWAAAMDPNQSGGLTYNIRVGTAPSRGDIVSSEARADGRRLLPRVGNAGWAFRREITGLVPGRTYFWSVQAVDNSFAGGPFATEGSFTLPELPGASHQLRPQLTADGQLSLTLPAATDPPWRLEHSPDLVHWSAVALPEPAGDGPFTVTLPRSATSSGAFYRLLPANLP